jgi:hypothetical protein
MSLAFPGLSGLEIKSDDWACHFVKELGFILRKLESVLSVF